jgi:hypothetical protein
LSKKKAFIASILPMEARHDGVPDSAPACRVVEYNGMQRQFLSGEVFDGEMEIIGVPGVTPVYDGFLEAAKIRKVTLTGFGDVTLIGEYFCKDFKGESLDISRVFSKVEHVEYGFLADAQVLQLHFSSFPALTQVDCRIDDSA